QQSRSTSGHRGAWRGRPCWPSQRSCSLQAAYLHYSCRQYRRRSRALVSDRTRSSQIPAIELFAEASSVDTIGLWRDLYRHEMNCQIVHDSLHGRNGWTLEYLLMSGRAVAGYGSIVVGG